MTHGLRIYSLPHPTISGAVGRVCCACNLWDRRVTAPTVDRAWWEMLRVQSVHQSLAHVGVLTVTHDDVELAADPDDEAAFLHEARERVAS